MKMFEIYCVRRHHQLVFYFDDSDIIREHDIPKKGTINYRCDHVLTFHTAKVEIVDNHSLS
jgi:hypothetical protein